MNRALPWLVVAGLGAVGFLIPLFGPKYFGLSPELNATLSGTMGGALVGAAGALLGMLIANWQQSLAEVTRRHHKKSNASKLIASELVNVAMGLIDFKKTMDIAVRTAGAGGMLPEHENFERDMPRAMPLTNSLGSDLLLLDDSAIDALVTLKSNLERTADGMREISTGRREFGPIAAKSLSAALGHDMRILAECFDRFAPDRKFKLNKESEPELAASILRRFAEQDISRAKIGEAVVGY